MDGWAGRWAGRQVWVAAGHPTPALHAALPSIPSRLDTIVLCLDSFSALHALKISRGPLGTATLCCSRLQPVRRPFSGHPPLASRGPLGMTTLMPGMCVKKASGDCEW